MSVKKLRTNIIVYFHADYTDDDGNPAKGRRHLIVEIDWENDKVFLLKITGKRKKLHQVTIGLVDCLDKISHSNLNRKLFFSISSLGRNNYENFYLCPFHSDGCLDKELFNIVKWKLQKFWDSRFNRDKEPMSLNGKLKIPEKFPEKWRNFFPKLVHWSET